MFKRFAFALLLVFAFSAAALAAKVESDRLSVDVPDGWTGGVEGSSISIVAADNSAAIVVALDSLGGSSMEDAVKAAAHQLKGGEITKDEDDVYSFDFTNEQGVPTHVIMSGGDGDFIMMSITASAEAMAAHQDAIQAILGSVEVK